MHRAMKGPEPDQPNKLTPERLMMVVMVVMVVVMLWIAFFWCWFRVLDNYIRVWIGWLLSCGDCMPWGIMLSMFHRSHVLRASWHSWVAMYPIKAHNGIFYRSGNGPFFLPLLVQHGPTNVSQAALKEGRQVLAITRTTNMRGKWKLWQNAHPQIVILSMKLKRKDPRHCKKVTHYLPL